MTFSESAFEPARNQDEVLAGAVITHSIKPMGDDGGLITQCVTVLFATETGASEEVARALGKAIEENGLASRVLDMADADISELMETEAALFVASTTGDGDAPYAAEGFFAALPTMPCPLIICAMPCWPWAIRLTSNFARRDGGSTKLSQRAARGAFSTVSIAISIMRSRRRNGGLPSSE